jgi:hypothetical protein
MSAVLSRGDHANGTEEWNSVLRPVSRRHVQLIAEEALSKFPQLLAPTGSYGPFGEHGGSDAGGDRLDGAAGVRAARSRATSSAGKPRARPTSQGRWTKRIGGLRRPPPRRTASTGLHALLAKPRGRPGTRIRSARPAENCYRFNASGSRARSAYIRTAASDEQISNGGLAIEEWLSHWRRAYRFLPTLSSTSPPMAHPREA